MVAVIEKYGIVTVLMCLVYLFVVIVGGVVVVTSPDTLDFETYLTLITGASGALGLLAVARGIRMQGTPPQP